MATEVIETGTEIIDGVVDNEEMVVESGGAGAKVLSIDV